MQLSDRDREFLSGERGEAGELAMKLLVAVGEAHGAARMIDIHWAHVAGAFDNGQANHDFAARLAAGGAQVAVPTTLTACSLDTQAPVSTRDEERAIALIDLYMGMGCRPVLTCAPYQARPEPDFGEHLAWCESSAAVYANSVLGARSNRYVEFLDICAAITGRAPEYGLHLDENRRATMECRLDGLPDDWLSADWFYPLLGLWLGEQAGDAVPAITGMPGSADRDDLRALGAAAATTGSLGMFHAVGVTPEAATLDEAAGHSEPEHVQHVTADDIRRAGARLCRNDGEALTEICLGAPHFSLEEFARLERSLAGRAVSEKVQLVVSTSHEVLASLHRQGMLDRLRTSGVRLVTGRCTYYPPAAGTRDGHVLTNSAKWAHYAPGLLGVPVTFAGLETCVESACAGTLCPHDEPWLGR